MSRFARRAVRATNRGANISSPYELCNVPVSFERPITAIRNTIDTSGARSFFDPWKAIET
jgi:hypothetical protein